MALYWRGRPLRWMRLSTSSGCLPAGPGGTQPADDKPATLLESRRHSGCIARTCAMERVAGPAGPTEWSLRLLLPQRYPNDPLRGDISILPYWESGMLRLKRPLLRVWQPLRIARPATVHHRIDYLSRLARPGSGRQPCWAHRRPGRSAESPEGPADAARRRDPLRSARLGICRKTASRLRPGAGAGKELAARWLLGLLQLLLSSGPTGKPPTPRCRPGRGPAMLIRHQLLIYASEKL